MQPIIKYWSCLPLYITIITLTWAAMQQQPRRFVLPPERKFVQLSPTLLTDGDALTTYTSFGKLRILQFNMLADGLSGLRQDLGAFSRVTAEDMNWDKRGKLLLHEILQYDPDIITLQECDHYYDCFLPELNARGYDGMFAPKPASACLEVSDNSDGCAIFVRRSKMYITSFEVS
jgi:mRNA deadenylase 3'-5' endonuclease subunit Ccr4